MEQVAALGTMVSESLVRIAAFRTPDALYNSVRYVLRGQGKRLRPVLLLLTAQMYRVRSEQALPAALAVEVSHNWALVHDDIMDQAATRRGRPSVYRRWDINTALLCGDVLMGIAYGQLTHAPASRLPQLLETFTAMVTALCEGQALDMRYETTPLVSTPEYLDMIDLKTGALLAAALEMGAILGEAPPNERAALRRAGMALGRAFQIQDDLLDLVADDGRWGKSVGQDLIDGKKTFLLLEALARATGEDQAFFERIRLQAGCAASDVAEARSRMHRLGVLAFARKNVAHYTRRAIGCLEQLHTQTDALNTVMQSMADRVH